MLVSVVIPTYNREKLLVRSVQSVLAQTYQDLELLIIDDASTDNTRVTINELLRKDPRVQVIWHNTNRGAQVARNSGIHAAKGELVAFLDSDNEWFPQKIAKQVELFMSKSDRPGAVYCSFIKVNPDNVAQVNYVAKYRGWVYRQTLKEWLTDTSTLIVRRDILERIGGFTKGLPAYHEWDFCIKLAKVCEFDFVPEILTIYHEHRLPSISKDYVNDALGYELILNKYHNEIISFCGKSTISEHYQKLARICIDADQFSSAQKYFYQSIKYDPFNMKSVLHYGVALFGKDVYNKLRRMLHETSN